MDERQSLFVIKEDIPERPTFIEVILFWRNTFEAYWLLDDPVKSLITKLLLQREKVYC